MTGEGAKAASVNIYGTNGPDDIKSYHGVSVSSNPDTYPMLIDGETGAWYKIGVAMENPTDEDIVVVFHVVNVKVRIE